MSYSTRRAVPCTVSLRLVGWTAPSGVAHAVYRGYLGSYLLQLVPECLVSIVQRRLEIIRAGVNKAKRSDS